MFQTYPRSFHKRNRWILDRRSDRHALHFDLPYDFFWEKERDDSGKLSQVATIFLTNRECPWKCFMCDLWKNTLTTTLPEGAIVRQIEFAFDKLRMPETISARAALQLKLYNNGSFFDSKAIIPSDYASIARRICGFKNLIVESHPRLIGNQTDIWQRLFPSPMEVALGLETVHPESLSLLNKGFALSDYARACEKLLQKGIAIRAFLLVNAPFIPSEEAPEWMARSIDFALDTGASVLSLIPTRYSNGAMRELLQSGLASVTKLCQLENAFENALLRRRGARIFADLWNLHELNHCAFCVDRRRDRLKWMNQQQSIPAPILCEHCDESHAHL